MITRSLAVAYIIFILVLPLCGLVWQSSQRPLGELLPVLTDPVALETYKLTFGTALVSGLINSVLGGLLAWVLVRYEFWGKRLVDGLVDLPFAMPTVIAGISLVSLYTAEGAIGKPLGRVLASLGFGEVNLTASVFGVLLSQLFVTLPFVVRTLQPVLLELEPEVEEAAALLGANRWQTFTRIIFPQILPAVLAGFALAVARAIGEYGVVVLVSGNIPYETLVATVYVYQRLEEFDYVGATAVAGLLIVVSLALLGIINFWQWWSRRYLL
ncbi:MAG: sulfate ABC transporter permease subunit CysT [Pseudanabaenaceae cyanobacterium]